MLQKNGDRVEAEKKTFQNWTHINYCNEWIFNPHES